MPATPDTCAWPPSSPCVAHFTRHARHFRGKGVELIHHRVDGVLELENFALHVDGDLARKVAARHRRCHLGDVAHLGREVCGQQVHVVGQILPGSRHARHHRLSAEAAVGADFTGDARHFRREGAQLLHHRVQRLLEQENLPAHVDGDLLGEVAAGDGRRHFGDVAHLRGQVRRHEVDVVGQILPRAGDAGHLRLTAELAFGAHFARHARHFRGKGVQLIHHRVDGVLELENFAFHVDGDLARQVAACHRRRHFGDVAHLGGKISRHRVDAVGQVFPRAGHAGHVRLSAEPSFGAHLARHARHLAGEAVELVHHGIQRFLQLKDFAAHVDGDLARKVAAGDGRRHFGDVAHLAGQIAGHGVHGVGQVFPGAGDAGHLRLSAELAVGAHLARHARHFRGEGVQLVHHRVDGFLQLKDLAADVHRDLLGKIALRHRGCDLGDVAHLAGQVAGHRVDAVGQILPRAGDAAHHRLSAKPPVGADLARHARHFRCKGIQLIDGRVDRFLQLQNLAAHVDRDLLRQVAVCHRGRHFGDVAHLGCQIAGHRVDAVGQVFPRAGDAQHVRLSAEPAVGADLARHARHFAGEGVQLVHHGVDGFLELENLAAHIHRDLLGKVAAGDGRRHFGDVAHLRGQVRRHEVDVVGQVFPCAGDARNLRLTAELAFGAHFARHAGDLRGESVQLVHHRIDGVFQLEDLAAHVDRDLARKIAARDRSRDLRDVAHLIGQVAAHRVHRSPSGPSRCRRRRARSPGRRACRRCPLRGPRASLPTQTSATGPPSC